MTIELKFPPNVVETNLDIKGVKVQIKKIDDDSYQLWINDDNCKYDLHNIPRDKYDYFNNNYIHHQYIGEYQDWEWWCNGLYAIRHTGVFGNGNALSYKEILVILESIENGVNKLEEIYNKPEIIKVGTVTIEKKRIDKDHECLSIYGLIKCTHYPIEICDNGNTVYTVSDNEFSVYDENDCSIFINNSGYFPIKDFKVSNEDVDKIVKIITASEKKLEEYYKEKDKINVGDIVTQVGGLVDLPHKVIGIHGNYVWTQYESNIPLTYLVKELKKI